MFSTGGPRTLDIREGLQKVTKIIYNFRSLQYMKYVCFRKMCVRLVDRWVAML